MSSGRRIPLRKVDVAYAKLDSVLKTMSACLSELRVAKSDEKRAELNQMFQELEAQRKEAYRVYAEASGLTT